jgi:hypothetical protein
MNVCHLVVFGLALALAFNITGFAQNSQGTSGDRPDAGGPYPRLPGAVTNLPDWIGADAPFDVARHFAAVPREQNAAPLYLDAFAEFAAEMAVCFPEGPDRDRRKQAADDRMRRYAELEKAIRADPNAVPPEQIDALIKEYETGFRKLAEAQRRKRCLFEAGLQPESPFPHTMAARQVARVAGLRVRRAVERGDLDAAISDVEAMLRLVRDLRHRGALIHQLVALAITQVVCTDPVKTILVAPGLRVEQCDRLLKVFLDHEARSGDGYAEGLRGEYLVGRAALRDHVRMLPTLDGIGSPGNLDRVVRDMNNYYRQLLDLDGAPYADRLRKVSDIKMTGRGDPLSAMVQLLKPSINSFVQATARIAATVRATECLIIMRRWQVTHRGLPRALLVAAREAGLRAVPIDPFDGNAMRICVIAGQSAVYSIGRDGVDDGGQRDSRYETRPGDLVYPLPPLEPSARPDPAVDRKGD